jgi:hypothetical protein
VDPLLDASAVVDGGAAGDVLEELVDASAAGDGGAAGDVLDEQLVVDASAAGDGSAAGDVLDEQLVVDASAAGDGGAAGDVLEDLVDDAPADITWCPDATPPAPATCGCQAVPQCLERCVWQVGPVYCANGLPECVAIPSGCP